MTVTTKTVLDPAAGALRFDTAETAYSPMFSNIGLEAKPDETGVGRLWLYYNRAARALFEKTVDVPLSYREEASSLTRLAFGERGALAFYGTDCFLFACSGTAGVGLLRAPSAATAARWIETQTEDGIVLRGYSKNADARDPDAEVPFRIALNAQKGKLAAEDANGICALPDENGEILVSIAVTLPEGEAAQPPAPPAGIDEAEALCRAWFTQYTAALRLPCRDEAAAPVIAAAVRGLLFNCARAPGMLKKHVSAFPNRGTYPTHFLWDTCFQNLAFELFCPALARDFLLQFRETQRSDGKYGQFLCSTWIRPHDTQPALIGWAALRLAKQTHELIVPIEMLPSIEANIRWWLNCRGTDTGLVYTLGGLETGQDDSPRFDNGPTIPCDMNAYLLNQMRAAAEMRRMLNMDDSEMTALADRFAKRLADVLYDPEDRIFYDLDLAARKRVKLVSPSSFLPLWAGADLPEAEAKASIRRYLLNDSSCFGKIPFPSVARDQPAYRSDAWWRGPTWLPIAWLMLELLDARGFKAEAKTAAERLYAMLLKDPDMHELFDSETGRGLGSAQQGWTCAVFMKLTQLLSQE